MIEKKKRKKKHRFDPDLCGLVHLLLVLLCLLPKRQQVEVSARTNQPLIKSRMIKRLS